MKFRKLLETKLEKLLDLIDDVKEKLTSEEYKSIMEELGRVNNSETFITLKFDEIYMKSRDILLERMEIFKSIVISSIVPLLLNCFDSYSEDLHVKLLKSIEEFSTSCVNATYDFHHLDQELYKYIIEKCGYIDGVCDEFFEAMPNFDWIKKNLTFKNELGIETVLPIDSYKCMQMNDDYNIDVFLITQLNTIH